jgi:hypothetical protein
MSEPKVCKNCLKEKDPSCFYKNLRMKDGLWNICKSCEKERYKRHYEVNRESILERTSKYGKENRSVTRKASKKYYHNNKEKEIARKRGWYSRNRSKVNSAASKYRASRQMATPDWLTDLQKKEIESFYYLAQDCKAVSGQSYHVDHIIPLNGKNVCGLHVPWNLQVLPSDVNISKSNTHD